MCGIIGYTGKNSAKDIITDGLFALEYRGYDSAGIAISDGEKIRTLKCGGRVSSLKSEAKNAFLPGDCGIGHTRWATHGKPDKKNAHPHESGAEFLVHNGIIENWAEIKKELTEEGYSFKSETDTEGAAHLIDREYKKTRDPVAAIYSACRKIRGSYAFAAVFKDLPEEIYAIRKDSPLIITKAEDGTYLASDIPALLPHGKEFIRPEENTVCRITKSGVCYISESGKESSPTAEKFTGDFSSAQKDGFESFMLKEMTEQPEAIKRAVLPRINAEGLPDFSADNVPDKIWTDISAVSVVACGSALHAGLIGKKLTESLAEIPVNVNIASEYRYAPPVEDKKTLVIFVSQSGETADTLAALRMTKAAGKKTLAIVNAEGSAIAEEADMTIYQKAGQETAVATTKGYSTQVVLFALIAVKAALARRKISETEARKICAEISEKLPETVSEIISRRDEIKKIAEKIKDKNDLYFIGRGVDFAIGNECSLKLKEISYIHSEAYAAGELKHGTIALIENGTPVVSLATDPAYYEKTASNILEVKARGAFVILVCGRDFENAESCADMVFQLSEDPTHLPAVVFSQLLAYETAKLRGCDPDRPRNLAKSVTVE